MGSIGLGLACAPSWARRARASPAPQTPACQTNGPRFRHGPSSTGTGKRLGKLDATRRLCGPARGASAHAGVAARLSSVSGALSCARAFPSLTYALSHAAFSARSAWPSNGLYLPGNLDGTSICIHGPGYAWGSSTPWDFRSSGWTRKAARHGAGPVRRGRGGRQSLGPELRDGQELVVALRSERASGSSRDATSPRSRLSCLLVMSWRGEPSVSRARCAGRFRCALRQHCSAKPPRALDERLVH